MIVYLDSSLLVSAYLVDEPSHSEVISLFDNEELALITGTWTRIEVSGALVRAAKSGQIKVKDLLSILDQDLSEDGPITVVSCDQTDVETVSLDLVRTYGIRAMDAWHLATASLSLPVLSEQDERLGFATRDREQAQVCEALGFELI